MSGRRNLRGRGKSFSTLAAMLRSPAADRKERTDCVRYPCVTPELEKWSGRLDSNQRPPAPKGHVLRLCATFCNNEPPSR
jgi:hypothetical protein